MNPLSPRVEPHSRPLTLAAKSAAHQSKAIDGITRGIQALSLNPHVVKMHTTGTQGTYLCNPYFALKDCSDISREQEMRVQQLFYLSFCNRVVPQTKLTGLNRAHFGMQSLTETDTLLLTLQEIGLMEFQAILKNYSPRWFTSQALCMGQNFHQRLSYFKDLYMIQTNAFDTDVFCFSRYRTSASRRQTSIY